MKPYEPIMPNPGYRKGPSCALCDKKVEPKKAVCDKCLKAMEEGAFKSFKKRMKEQGGL